MSPYRITAHDRDWYRRCRRAWDLGATARHNLEPIAPAPPPGPAAALSGALAVYYFPGMWAWPRDVVLPKVQAAAPPLASLVEAYARWAPDQDDFEPIQVRTEVEVNVPDPVLSDRDLSTDAGEPVRYWSMQDALVFRADGRPWMMSVRVVEGDFTDPDILAIDGTARTDCWAWRQLTFDNRIAGALFTEVVLDGRFRRTAVPYSPADLDIAGRHLGAEVMEMLDAGLALYPHPDVETCRVCAFRRPCLTMQSGSDPSPELAAGFRTRPPAPPVEGVLGGRTWSVGRGARPYRFGDA